MIETFFFGDDDYHNHENNNTNNNTVSTNAAVSSSSCGHALTLNGHHHHHHQAGRPKVRCACSASKLVIYSSRLCAHALFVFVFCMFQSRCLASVGGVVSLRVLVASRTESAGPSARVRSTAPSVSASRLSAHLCRRRRLRCVLRALCADCRRSRCRLIDRSSIVIFFVSVAIVSFRMKGRRRTMMMDSDDDGSSHLRYCLDSDVELRFKRIGTEQQRRRIDAVVVAALALASPSHSA
jgi:hypothetical protein